jgi:hypothetical protein
MDQIKKTIVSIAKIDGGKQIMKGVVYKPNELDAHGDWMTAEDIEKSAHKFMKDLKLQNVDTNHSQEKVDAYVCESYIAKSGDPDGYPVGSWIVAIKVEDPDVWQGVLKGDYEAFSMQGTAYAISNVDPPAIA